MSTNAITHIHILKGDITRQKTDAIVNAANPGLLGGGGVDGAIHRAAGPELLHECQALGGCKRGEARITGGYNLPAKYIIHTPGPIYKDKHHDEDKVLKNSYHNSLVLAKENKIQSISFPAISTGVYGYPKEEACRIAIKTCVDFMEKNNYFIEIYFILYDDVNYAIYNKIFQSLYK